MTIADLAVRVTWSAAASVAAMTAGAWGLAGADAAAGVAGGGGGPPLHLPCLPPRAGGGAIALLNFRWLAHDVGRATSMIAEGRGGAGRIGRIGLRQLVTFGGLGLLIAKGWAHPVGVGVGLAVLPL